ncbi:hypothetical protein L1887_63293 [Cichorium endivia]|nr:hypothetical protein L1887_63293 [Cichorium endivia]
MYKVLTVGKSVAFESHPVRTLIALAARTAMPVNCTGTTSASAVACQARQKTNDRHTRCNNSTCSGSAMSRDCALIAGHNLWNTSAVLAGICTLLKVDEMTAIERISHSLESDSDRFSLMLALKFVQELLGLRRRRRRRMRNGCISGGKRNPAAPRRDG